MAEEILVDEGIVRAARAYVKKHYVAEDEGSSLLEELWGHLQGAKELSYRSATGPSSKDALNDLLKSFLKLSEKTFSEALLRLMERRGIKPTDLYKKTGLTKAHFSKIKTNRNYQPSKETALALVITLQLSLDEANDLLQRAGYSLSHSRKSDLVVEYSIKKKIYDVDTVNILLHELGLPPLTNRRKTKNTDE